MRMPGALYRAILMVVAISWSHSSRAQFMGDEYPAFYGLSAGTQDDPSLSLDVPFTFYKTSKLVNGSGDVVAQNFTMRSPSLNFGFNLVTNLKILQANYGAGAYVSFASNRIESTNKILSSQSAFAFSDMYVQPIELGWHTTHADFTVGYSMYVPTGKYVFNGGNNYGLGMWAYEPYGGVTVYLDSEQTWNLSSIFFYEMHSTKKNTPYRVGDIFVAEGGLCRSFTINTGGSSLDFQLGPTYYCAFKVTSDAAPAIINTLIRNGGRDRVFSLGGELDCQFNRSNTCLSARWLYEFGAHTRFEGQNLYVSITQRLRSFEKSNKTK